MNNRRMFSLRIANSARFLQMPTESQLLYFHMVLRADDDGVVESYPLLKLLGSTPDAFRVLLARGFVRELNEDQVVIIADWKEHNTIRADRKVDSIYKSLILEKAPDIKLLEPKPRSDVNDNTKRVGGQSTDGISKVKLSKYNTYTNTELTVNTNTEHNNKHKRQSTPPKEPATPLSKYKTEYQEWVTAYNTLYKQRYGVSASNLNNFKNSREAYSLEDMIAALKNLPRHDWLKDKHTPTLILRQTDRSGQPVDRIGELLSYRVKTLREQLEEQS